MCIVHELLSIFPTIPTVEHIKGHQERIQSYESLDVISQMNVDADALATTELKEYGSILPTVPFDPVSQVLLHVNGRTVTYKLISALVSGGLTRPRETSICGIEGQAVRVSTSPVPPLLCISCLRFLVSISCLRIRLCISCLRFRLCISYLRFMQAVKQVEYD